MGTPCGSFPQRWFASESAIISNTQELLSGLSTDIGHYIQVSGTVKALPERVAAELYDWFGDNQDWMVQLGMIQASDDYADHIPDVMVQVDTVGNLPVGWVVGLSIAAAVCLAYALYELIRILCKGYAAPQAAEPEDADLSDIDVEITESDPETGEDVTDIDVEIIEEAPTEDADA